MAGGEGRLRWIPQGTVEALAEPEAAKVDMAHAAQWDESTMVRLGVADAAQLRARLAALADSEAAAIATADAAPTWRACARSLISPYGSASAPQSAKASSPSGASINWRIGEVWRIRVALANGWVDDRIVRFTGDLTHPAAVVGRRLMRGDAEGERCDALFAAG
jgi:hypothetical protein